MPEDRLPGRKVRDEIHGLGRCDPGMRDVSKTVRKAVSISSWEYFSTRRTYLGNASTLFPTQFLRLMHKHLRANSNILRIRAAICQPKHLVADFESALRRIAQSLDYARELHSKSLGSLRRYWILSDALKKIHAIETKSFNLDEALVSGGVRLGDIGDVESFDRAFSICDVSEVLV